MNEPCTRHLKEEKGGEMNTYQYGVLPWHGFFGDFATIVSAHKTSEAAITAARRGRYINERGEVVYPRAVVFRESGFAKGDRIWSNAYPEVIWYQQD